MKEYKRLTIKNEENGLWGIDGKLVNQKQKPLDVFEEAFYIAVTRLAEIEDKIENGTLIELPCKVGDKVYVPFFKTVYSFKIVKVEIYEEQIVLIDDSNNPIFLGELGNTVFFTKAEAEQKLKELREV